MPGSLHTAAFGAPATALLVELVAGAKGDDPFAPVTVVVSSATAGTTLRRRLALELGGLLHVAFVSLPQVADQLAAPHLASGRVAGGVSPMVARAHLRSLLRGGTALTSDPLVATSAATERALIPTFAELEPLPEATLDQLAATGPQVGALVDLFRRYRATTGGDPAGHDIAAAAAALVAARTADPRILGTVIVHLPRRFRVGELALLDALAARLPLAVVVGRTGDGDADVVADELLASLVPRFGPPVASGEVGPGGSVPTKVIWAPDPAEEVAMAVREVVAALTGTGADPPVRPERIAVVHRVRDPYAGSLHAALDAARVPHHVAAITTLAQSVPGRVLTALVDVSADGFRRHDVTGLWRAGPVVDPVTGGRVQASRWDALARAAGIGGGLEQWHQRIDQAVAARQDYLARRTSASHGEPLDPVDDGDEPTEPVDRSIRHLLAVDAHIRWLADALTPPAEASWTAWSGWLRSLLSSLLHPEVASKQGDAVGAVDRILVGIAALDGVEPTPDLERLRRVLEPELAHPDRRHGRFGHGVLVGRMVDVVGADLDLVVILGAADGRFPPRRREDPLLPDGIRATTGGLLAPRGLRREEEHRDYLAALASAPRRVLIGHRADPREQRERQPAAWLVAACSSLAGNAVASADLATLRAHPWYVEVPSFEAGPAGLAGQANPFELDLGDLLADHRRGDVAGGVVAAGHPELARGLTAGIARREGRFDEWSGHVDISDELVVSLGRPLSPTSLEQYAVCPFRYLLRTVLRVGAIDDPAEAELISALDEGSLVHEILERFIAGAPGKPAQEAWSAADRARLRAIVDEVGARYQAEGRTGRTLLWQVRLEQLHRQLLGVLDRDQELRAAAGVSPVAVELTFGDEGDPPVTVTLAGGRTIAFKGSIDRVDQSPDGRRLVVYDYKTGSPRAFDKVRDGIARGDLTASGTKLQLPIYALAAQARFGDAQEVAAHYWFVGRKGEGRTLGAPVDDAVNARFQDVMEVVVEGIEAGRFPANPGKEEWTFGRWSHANCSWCDFDRVCATTRGEAWVQLRTNPALARYVELAEGPPDADTDTDDTEREP